MKLALKVILSFGGLLLVFIGFGFLTDPVASGADFGLAVEGAHGLTSVRGDMTSFFTVSGACLLWGAWGERRDPLIIGGALMLVVLLVRVISLFEYGTFDGFETPMVFEGIVGTLGLIAARILPARD
ncbi:hypothetical protein INR77_15770 [Erythrobacter sp. SCSIO 43205]|uniref:hypothetical protein n=1 Tax=Erythrobacter sp. SCSIO 43205 TaxID=2779361 RepID=UPI001CA9C018|nr:hypothetical protein [Erythrobacter sp. SCSIO 43205]UAB78176.1 hypothetical protein INR77_15770 [Erythrobacter sp. SCSIO 43205]